MNKKANLDYKKEIEMQLATKDEKEKKNASEFLGYLSDLILKYTNLLEEEISSHKEKR